MQVVDQHDICNQWPGFFDHVTSHMHVSWNLAGQHISTDGKDKYHILPVYDRQVDVTSNYSAFKFVVTLISNSRWCLVTLLSRWVMMLNWYLITTYSLSHFWEKWFTGDNTLIPISCSYSMSLLFHKIWKLYGKHIYSALCGTSTTLHNR